MWQGQPAQVIAATLRSYGRVSWNTLTEALCDATAAWADYGGFHIGAAPATAPPYTHVWAWADTWMLRARIDGDQAIAATLHLQDSGPEGLAPCGTPSTVNVTWYRSRTWPARDQRVGPIPGNVTDQPVDLYQIDGTHPITFIRCPESRQTTRF